MSINVCVSVIFFRKVGLFYSFLGKFCEKKSSLIIVKHVLLRYWRHRARKNGIRAQQFIFSKNAFFDNLTYLRLFSLLILWKLNKWSIFSISTVYVTLSSQYQKKSGKLLFCKLFRKWFFNENQTYLGAFRKCAVAIQKRD